MSMFQVVGEGSYNPNTDSLTMHEVESKISTTAITALVNDHLTYKEGWELSATDMGSYVSVYVEFTADNSTPRSIDARPWVIGDHTFNLYADTREHVQCEILYHLMSIEAHETTEFLRFDGVAPFHPHRADGRHRYQAAQDSHAGLPEQAT